MLAAGCARFVLSWTVPRPCGGTPAVPLVAVLRNPQTDTPRGPFSRPELALGGCQRGLVTAPSNRLRPATHQNYQAFETAVPRPTS